MLMVVIGLNWQSAMSDIEETKETIAAERASVAENTARQRLLLYQRTLPQEAVERGVIPFTEEDYLEMYPDTSRSFNIQVYEGRGLDKLLFQEQPDDGFDWVLTEELRVDNALITFRFGIKDDLVPESIRERPRTVLVGGSILAFLVSVLVYMMLQRRSQSLARKEDHKVQRAKDNMLSLASHQLRTPATGVKQYVGMVLEGFTGKITKDQREMLERAYESNERQLRIINEFLYLAKADADRIILTPQQFDLIPFTKQIVDDMSAEINEAGHTVEVKHGAKNLQCVADTHSARMIIENLISNAIKYTPPGGKITVTLKGIGHEVAVIVRDNGVGIARKDLPRLFQQFSRIPNPMSKHSPGSGIGLYLARYLAAANHGNITVESNLGVGSTFTARFPRRNVKKLTEAIKERF